MLSSDEVRPDSRSASRVARIKAVSGASDAAAGNGVEKDEEQKEDVEQERQLWEGGYSYRAMIPMWIAAGLVILFIAGTTAPWVEFRTGLFIALVTAVLCLGGVGLYLAYRRLSVHYELTNQRLIYQTGLLTRITDRIDLVDVDDVAYGQERVERLLGVGTIQIISGDRSPGELLLTGIQDVSSVATKIDHARRAARRRRGLYIEAF